MTTAARPDTRTAAHPLAAMLAAAASGSFPPPDGSVTVLPPADDVHAVVAFSAHSLLLTDRTQDEVVARGLDAYGGSMHPDHQHWLAGERLIGSLDVVLVRRATGRSDSVQEPTLDLDHPRIRRAEQHRRDVRVSADAHGLVTIGRGLVDRWEISVELFDGVPHGRGAGRALIDTGLAMLPEGEAIWAQVAAGNTASLRAFLGAGFVPICSEVLFSHRPD